MPDVSTSVDRFFSKQLLSQNFELSNFCGYWIKSHPCSRFCGSRSCWEQVPNPPTVDVSGLWGIPGIHVGSSAALCWKMLFLLLFPFSFLRQRTVSPQLRDMAGNISLSFQENWLNWPLWAFCSRVSPCDLLAGFKCCTMWRRPGPWQRFWFLDNANVWQRRMRDEKNSMISRW